MRGDLLGRSLGRLLGLSVGCTQIWVSGDGILHRKRLLSVTGGTIVETAVGIKGNFRW